MTNSDFCIPAHFPCIAPTKATQTRFGAHPHFAEGLYNLGTDTYAWMVPNGSWGEANAGLIVGDGASLLIDTLWDVKFTGQMLDTMQAALGHPPITTVVNSHADGDHFWGNQLVADTDIITSAPALAEMAHKKPGQMLAFAKLGHALGFLPFKSMRQTGAYFKAMGAPYDFANVTYTPAKRAFSGRTTLDIGGRTIHLIEVGPAHTSGDLIIHVPDARTVFAADIMFLGSTPVMWAGPLENWLNALDLIISLEPEIIVPGHGPLTDLKGVAQVKAYWHFVADATRTRFDKGMSPRAAAFDIAASTDFAKQTFATWNAPERLMTNTHMLYREFSGKTGHPALPLLLKILAQQARLAASMRD